LILENIDSLSDSENVLVLRFLANQRHPVLQDREIPFSKADTVLREMSFKYGRADIVIFHTDGSATVIEAKVGRKGYNHVVAGIGQASLYASQLPVENGAITKVRKALLFSSTGDKELDLQIKKTCTESNTIPLLYLSHEEYTKLCAECLAISIEKERQGIKVSEGEWQRIKK